MPVRRELFDLQIYVIMTRLSVLAVFFRSFKHVLKFHTNLTY